MGSAGFFQETLIRQVPVVPYYGSIGGPLKYLFSSPELNTIVSFSDPLSYVDRPSVHLVVRLSANFSLFNLRPFQPNWALSILV